jgi:thiamine-monophosphate kinase
LLVGLTAPASLPVRWALDFAAGLAAACAGTGAGVVGGDLSGGDQIVISVTALGDLQGRAPVLRSGAQPGDVVAVAGVLGQSAAGLALLRAGRADLAPELVAAHRRPQPPYGAGLAAAVEPSRASAMLDLSDGLLRDLGRIARASAVEIELDPQALAAYTEPLAAVGHELRVDPLTWVATGGEDHGLAATFPPGVRLPSEFTVIGAVRTPKNGPAVLLPKYLGEPTGWDHFKLA